TAMTRVASKQKLTDTESGFRAYSRRALERLELKEGGMAVSSEIVSAAAAAGLEVAEVPISVSYTGEGSTLNPVQHGLGVLNRILVMISERRPLLIFGIIGALCIIAGIILGVLVVQVLASQQVLQVGSALMSMLFITVGALSVFTGIILNVLARRIDRLLK
ncbi:glycosyltransferase family 2 protein, partial [Chloroflexota bacterium]